LYDRPILLFEMVKAIGSLYELRSNGAHKLPYAMERLNAAISKELGHITGADEIEMYDGTVADMTKAYMEHVYFDKPIPVWLKQIEDAKVEVR
jgi:hypothetical protein